MIYDSKNLESTQPLNVWINKLCSTYTLKWLLYLNENFKVICINMYESQ